MVKAIRIPRGPVTADWTLAQALAADRRFKASGNDSLACPINQYSMLTVIFPVLEAEFKAGKEMAFPQAIYLSAMYDVPMPSWVATRFMRSFDAIQDFEMASWDEVFVLPIAAGKKTSRARKLRFATYPAWLRVREKVREGLPKDKGTFEIVADEMNASKKFPRVNATDVGEFFYMVERGASGVEIGPAGYPWQKLSLKRV